METTTATKQIVVKAIPVELWRRLKIHTATNGQTIQSAVAEAIEAYLQKSA